MWNREEKTQKKIQTHSQRPTIGAHFITFPVGAVRARAAAK